MKTIQKIIRIDGNPEWDVQPYLDDGWHIKDFKPVAENWAVCGASSNEVNGNIYCYILLEKYEDIKVNGI